MLGASTAVARLAGNIIVPLMCVYLALCAAGTVAPIGIDSIAKGVKSFAVWVMSASAALFSGIMGVGSIVSSSADGAGAKAVKFVVGSAVPVVGGTVSDALAAAKSCLIMARNVLGAYAIVAAAVIFIPPVISAFAWKICLFPRRGGKRYARQQAAFIAAFGKLRGNGNYACHGAAYGDSLHFFRYDNDNRGRCGGVTLMDGIRSWAFAVCAAAVCAAVMNMLLPQGSKAHF